jgi:hypothetical protein
VKGLAAAWLAYLGIATYQWERANTGNLPPPSIYLGSSLVFAGLSVVGLAAPGFASVFAWALIVSAGVAGKFSDIAAVPSPVAAGQLNPATGKTVPPPPGGVTRHN